MDWADSTMKTSMRDGQEMLKAIPLAFFLCAVAGSIDALGYLLFGGVFVGNMTGNTVLFAVSILRGDHAQIALRGGVVAAFFAGILLVRILLRPPARSLLVRLRFCVLGAEFAVLLLLSLLPAGRGDGRYLLLVLAGILGAQNGAFQQIGRIRLNTAFITGDLEKLGESMTERRHSWLRASVFFATWVAYAFGALAGAIGAQEWRMRGFWIAAVLVVAAAISIRFAPPPVGSVD